MNPLKLEITNYRAFSKGVLDLEGISAAAVVGQNGAGKSTLLESMLFALYGESRSSRIDDIVKIGQELATVDVTYEHGGNVYRVIRKRSRGKKSELQYLMQNYLYRDSPEVDPDSRWIPLTLASLADTEEKIARDLGMNKALFLATACVLQGDAAGICTATPADRKKVLYELLEDRLKLFPQRHELAKAKVAEIDRELEMARRSRQTLSNSIAERSAYESQKTEAHGRIMELQEELDRYEARAEETRKQISGLEADAARKAELEKQIVALDSEIASLRNSVASHQQALREAEELTSQAEFIRKRAARADELEVEIREHEGKREKHQALLEEYRADDGELDKRYQLLMQDIQKVGNHLVQRQVSSKAEIDSLQRELDAAKKQAELLEQVPCKGTDLQSGCQLLANAVQAAATTDSLQAKINGYTKAYESIEDDIAANDKRSSELEVITQQKAELLESNRKKAGLIGYNKDAHQAAVREYDGLKGSRAQLAQIAGAEAKVQAERSAVVQGNAQIQQKNEQVQKITGQISELQEKLKTHSNLVCKLATEESVVKSDREQIEAEQRKIAVADERLKDISGFEEQLRTVELEMHKLEVSRPVYQTLTQWYHRDGIPALIIDNAIPAIEELANEILAKLSDGRMSLKLVTQKLTGSGISETLDIIVSDREGERSYENWSGGEQMRIALALRVGLGQFLARRAGASVRTLFLDEVCGPLDTEGKDALIDCIGRLGELFDTIFLITHHEDLQDRLPQKIILTKTGSGSEIRVA